MSLVQGPSLESPTELTFSISFIKVYVQKYKSQLVLYLPVYMHILKFCACTLFIESSIKHQQLSGESNLGWWVTIMFFDMFPDIPKTPLKQFVVNLPTFKHINKTEY